MSIVGKEVLAVEAHAPVRMDTPDRDVLFHQARQISASIRAISIVAVVAIVLVEIVFALMGTVVHVAK